MKGIIPIILLQVAVSGTLVFANPIVDEFSDLSESEAMTILVSNHDFLRFYPPSIRVRVLRRSPGEAVKGLLGSLVQKGILASEEAANGMQSTSPPVPSDNP